MAAITMPANPAGRTDLPSPVLGRALQPGVVLLGSAGEALCADARALALLGCSDATELAGCWAAIQPHLEAQGMRLSSIGTPAMSAATAPGGGAAGAPARMIDVELPAPAGGNRRLRISLICKEGVAAAGRGGSAATGDGRGGVGGWGALLVQDAELAAALESDLRAASQMRSLAQIAPAVAHDLRAPINAMSLNLEVLKEALAAGPSPFPVSGDRDPRQRQQRYVNVLREELSRLHQSLELFLAHISPRGDRLESLDLREPARDLAALLVAPARKQQGRVEVLVPDAPVPVLAQRFLLRQALLHLGLAVLAQVPRDGTLEIRLERQPRRARLRIIATALGAAATSTSPATSAISASPPPPLEPSFTAAGTEARLEVAGSILGMFGGAARPLGAVRAGMAADDAPPAVEIHGAAGVAAVLGAMSAFEIDFPLSDSN